MGLHLSAPWSFYNAQGELDGIEYQLVSRIFSRAGYQVEYELHNYSRLIKQFSEKKLDCASPVAVPVEGAHFSQPYLPFQDVAISLRQAGVLLNNLDDLAGKRIVAYQQALQVLGPDFIRACWPPASCSVRYCCCCAPYPAAAARPPSGGSAGMPYPWPPG